jgi:putative ABC transport system permease protein
MREVQYALRRLRGSPMFTVAATLTLAIAIGATASVFGLVDAVLFKAFPYRDANELRVIYESDPAVDLPNAQVAPADYLDLRAQTHTFPALAAYLPQQLTVTGRQESERVIGAAVTPNYFSVLGLSPIIGRPLAADSNGPPEVVIGYGLWQRRFGGSRAALGQTLTIDNQPYTVVGVAPAGIPTSEELFTRLSFKGSDVVDRGDKELYVFGRPRAGVTTDGVQRDVETIAHRLGQAYPMTNKGWSIVVHPLLDEIVKDVRPTLIMLLAAAACVLLIGVANLANLFLVRCLAREREIALRTALGATRRQIIREYMLETGILSVAAGVLGVGVAAAGVRVLRALAPASLPRLSEVTLDGRVVGFCASIAVGTVLLFGIAPVWQVSRGKLIDVLKQGGRASGSTRHRRAQDLLVVLQVAVALMLLTGAGLLVESVEHFRRVDPGFRPTGVLTAQFLLPPAQYSTPERQTAFATRLADALSNQPGIAAAGIASYVPASDGNDMEGFAIAGDPLPDVAHVPLALVMRVTPTYLRAMGITLQRGRGVLASDDSRGVKVAVVDELLARRYFGRRDPIGQHITFYDVPDTMEVVGIALPIKQQGLAAHDFPEIYLPFAQSPSGAAMVAVRVAGDPAAQATAVRRVIAGLDPTVPMFDVKTMSQRMTQSVSTTRFSTFLASLFAVVALILGTVGIYSVLAYIVTQRRRDIGVRRALGASSANVMTDVIQRALALTGTGIVLGGAGAWAATSVLASLFVGVGPHDPIIYGAAAGALGMVALAAAGIPAFRATRVDPVVALH